jgi:hypothetical protein
MESQISFSIPGQTSYSIHVEGARFLANPLGDASEKRPACSSSQRAEMTAVQTGGAVVSVRHSLVRFL